MSVPGAGKPVALKGTVGAMTDDTVSVAVPVLATTTLSWSGLPIGTVPKATVAGLEARPGLVPTPLRMTLTGPRLVFKVSVPLAAPAAVGVNDTGMLSVPPAFSVAGRIPDVVAVKGPDTVALLIVMVPEALSWAAALPVVLTACSPKLTAGADRVEVAALPNARRCPSRVPT